jgi:hypothetical protein
MRPGEPSDAIAPEQLRGGVLSLDLATRVGWAFASAAGAGWWPRSRPFSGLALVPAEPRPPVTFGTLITGKPGSSHGDRAAMLAGWLSDIQEEWDPGVIVIEQPMPAKFSKNLAATQIAIGLSMIVQGHAARRGCAFRQVPIISAKAWFGSKLQKDKAPMMACARSLGWEVGSDHEADALAILDLTLARAAIARKVAQNIPEIIRAASAAERRRKGRRVPA